MSIALVDEDHSTLTAVSTSLEAEGFLVEVFEDGQAALEAFEQKMPQLTILGVKAQRMSGEDLLGKIRETTTMPVIFLTSKDGVVDAADMLRMGADDYLMKPFPQRVLIERIRHLLNREDTEPASENRNDDDGQVLVRGQLLMNPLRHEVIWKGQAVALTVTEFLLLKALADRPGFVKSRENLMDVAYDENVYVDDRTIDSHIKRLRKKMRKADEEFDAIETLYGVGYRYNQD